ncbi:hypothetical protein XHC_1589 [Xanthomonas hortorum pv. carotae str. M081]|nr:hypothetical protein XHC_1589 [Xanthomonas hortorum pv. carotae str. M081]
MSALRDCVLCDTRLRSLQYRVVCSAEPERRYDLKSRLSWK